MRVVTLLENESINDKYKSAHGLSLYIEHGSKKILFDIGPGNQYIKNAKKLGIHLEDVDYLIISHGHFDHGRGLSKFLRLNKKAEVFISKHAFQKHYKNKKGVYLPIGIRKPISTKRFIFIEDDFQIEKGIKIVADVTNLTQMIPDNSLLKKTQGGFEMDDFEHEIYLVLYHNRARVLFSGCSHKGIENIIDSIEKKDKRKFTAVVGGYHFSHYDSGNLRQSMYLEQLATKFIENDNAMYYTGHCTGNDAFIELKNTMKDQLVRIKTGTEFKV